MPFSDATDAFNPETLALLSRAFEEAWVEVLATGGAGKDITLSRSLVAERIMNAARNGVRDLATLRAAGCGRG